MIFMRPLTAPTVAHARSMGAVTRLEVVGYASKDCSEGAVSFISTRVAVTADTGSVE